MNFSAASLALLPSERREKILRSLTDEEIKRLAYAWPFWAREAQIAPPGDWVVWMILAGRGFGKTRSGVEWIRERVEAGGRRLILAGATAGDVRDIMVEGESGILAQSPPWNRPTYMPSKSRLTWPNGARALLLSADEPERFRGKQCDTFWADELASWRYPEAWDQLQFGFRLAPKGLGVLPRGIVTTTPRPTPIIKELVADPTTVVTGGTTYENRANLADAFFAKIIKKYEGTRLGEQELKAKILDDAPGALWKRAQIDALRVDEAPALHTIVVAIDPAVSTGEGSNETGIVVAGVGADGHGYVLDDLSDQYTPDGWGKTAVNEYLARKANRIVAERNQGGDLVESNIKTAAEALEVRGVFVTTVHASHGKRTRAEPISALYEQGRVHHVGSFGQLEDQLCTWEPDIGDSPDRLDALVWALTDLMIDVDPRRHKETPKAVASKFARNGARLGRGFKW